MEWVASTLHTTSEHGLSSITTADAAHLGCQQSTELTPSPADLNGLVSFVERRNLVSACVPSHFNWSLPFDLDAWLIICGPDGCAIFGGKLQSLFRNAKTLGYSSSL